MMARWIRLGAMSLSDFEAACARLAQAQSRAAPPILAWGQAEPGPGQPHHDARYLFALISPRKFAPGRPARWFSWALASAVATYRQFGFAAYLEGESIWLHGRKIADGTVKAIGECVVVASSFLARFPAQCVATPSLELEQAFRLRLEAQHGWQFDHSWPTEPEKLRYAVA